MNGRIKALILIAIFIVATLAAANQVSASFTLGDLTGTYPYHTNDFDPHVPGVIGYVWPGGGQDAFNGFPNFASVNNAPGYQAPYPSGKPPGAPGASNVGGAPSSSWYQLEGDSYSPFGAILTGSTGDLIFALNATAFQADGTTRFTGRWQGVDILIPPGFAVPGAPEVVTTITNDYSGIAVARISPYDRYAPGWTVVQVLSDAGMDAAKLTSPTAATPYYDHQGIDFSAAGEWYYVRINGVVAPSIAGRYFFKILLEGGTPSICGEEGVGGGAGSLPTMIGPPTVPALCSQFIPTENWPVLLVKGEIDPAILTGTIRYAGYNATLYSQPVQEAGRVYAKMTTRLDPYTGQQRPDLPLVDAMGYFNATAKGHYEVEGVAPGIYDLYAEAAGFPTTLIASSVTVLKGQSLHFDGYLQPGAVIHGNVFSKHQFGDEPWPLNSGPAGQTVNPNTYIKIELYDGPTLNHQPDSSANLVSWSPLPCVAGGQELYTGRYTASACNDPRLGDNVAFPWHEYNPGNGYGVPTPGAANGFYQVAAGGAAGSGTYFNDFTQDPEGVGPPQHWFVLGGTTTPFHFEFGVKGEYGAPRDLDGMVPQVYATWVNGLTPGRYYARAWVFRYVQSALDGSTFQEYYFDITPNEWAGDVSLPMDLRLSSWVNKTVHFHNVINGITEDPIDTGAGAMSGVLVDSNGQVWSYNQTLLGYQGRYTTGARSGWQSSAFSTTTTTRNRNDLDKAKLNQFAIETGRANIQFWGWNDTWGGENYGIPSGTYTPHVYVLGYIEQNTAEQVSVTLSGNPTSISDHMYRGAGLNITAYSIDWERPTVARNWVWGQWGDGQTPATSCGTNGCSVNSGQMPYMWGAGYTVSGLSPIPPMGDTNSFQYNPTTGLYRRMVGQEIDIGVYQNGTLIDFIGDQPSNLQDTTPTSCLFQNDTTSSVQMCGGGWDVSVPGPGIFPSTSGTGYIPYQGNTYDAYFGQELGDLGFVGGYSGGISYYTTRAILFAPAHFSPTTLPDGGTYEQAVTGYTPLYPSAIPTGQYTLRGYTYGYVQDQSFTAYASSSQVSDIRLNMIIGVNVTLDILFKKEHIITPTDANMSARVRLFDDSGNLVAEWMSSEGTYVTGNGFARASDGTTQYPFGPLHTAVPYPQLLNGYNYLPGGVTLLHVLMSGLPQVPPAGTDDGVISRFVPEGVYFNDPLYATTTCGFQLNCYTSPGTGLGVGVPGYFPNTGILGAPDYQGGWTAEVDFVNWYMNNSGTPELLSSNPSTGANVQVGSGPGTPSTTSGPYAQYYPPVDGLLMGESYHIIPGTTSTSGISFTEDNALKPELIGHTLAMNHLGPYSQEGTWSISGAHLSGEASGIFEVDLNGFVSGNALAYTWAQDFRPVSWGTVSIAAAAGGSNVSFTQYTFDGIYQTYLPPGTYQFTISAPGLTPQTLSVSVTSGQTGTGQNVYLQQSQIPVPEFSAIAVVLFSALGASLYVLRRRRR